MKHFVLFISALLVNLSVYSQTIVSTVPAGRNAVLEELTGVGCPNCPDGHARADALFAAYPGRVVIINMHGTAYSGTPNLVSSWVDPIDAFINPTGYPSGSMNRKIWSGAYNEPPYFPQNPPNNLAIRRPGWWDTGYPGQTTGEWIILNGGNSFVNIGATSTYNSGTGEITIYVELYYTANSPVATNKLNVAILQNGVIGYQSGGSSTYNHKNILRDLVTGQWGESITQTTSGSLVTRTYTYALPATYNGIASDISNTDVVIFVTQDDNKNIETGVKISAQNGSTLSLTEDGQMGAMMNIYPNPVTESAILEYQLNKQGIVFLTVSNAMGQIVYSNELGNQETGLHQFDIGSVMAPFSSGLYTVYLLAGSEKMSHRLLKE